jgi:hypothetical protein
MTCSICQCDGFKTTEDTIQVCWCREDVCAGCLEQHILTCEWFQKGVPKPEDKPKKKTPWPKVERAG